MSTKDPQAELTFDLEASKYLMKWAAYFATKGTGYFEHHEKDMQALKELTDLIQAHQQEVLNELYAIYKDAPTIQKGYEALVSELFTRIERKRGELNGQELL